MSSDLGLDHGHSELDVSGRDEGLHVADPILGRPALGPSHISTRFLHADRRTRESNFEERALYGLLTLGLTDRTEGDRPFPSSTRSMRFASCMGDHLWALLEQERARVSSQRYFGGPKLTDCCREIALEGEVRRLEAKVDQVKADMLTMLNTDQERDKYVDHELDKLQQRADRQRNDMNGDRKKRHLVGSVGSWAEAINTLTAKVDSMSDHCATAGIEVVRPQGLWTLQSWSTSRTDPTTLLWSLQRLSLSLLQLQPVRLSRSRTRRTSTRESVEQTSLRSMYLFRSKNSGLCL
jgi:FtsZ-binding cell division protein ZapB